MSELSALQRFGVYAAAFEKAYASDDWSEVGEFFHDDAVYEVHLPPPIGGRFEGREEILAYFKRVLDGFDRRFASRTIAPTAAPREEGDRVVIRGRADYTADGAPDVGFELEEVATFDGDRIRRLEDNYGETAAAEIEVYLTAHGEALGLAR